MTRTIFDSAVGFAAATRAGKKPSIAGRLGGRIHAFGRLGGGIRDLGRLGGRVVAASRAASFWMALVLGALAGPAMAQVESSRPFAAPSTVTSSAPSGVASLGQVTLALALVLAVIFVAAWLLRRVRGLGRSGTGALDILADLPVGQKERAVLIRVGTTQVLLGVAPGRVTTLHVLSEPVTITPPTVGSGGPGHPARPNFKDLLMKSLGK